MTTTRPARRDHLARTPAATTMASALAIAASALALPSAQAADRATPATGGAPGSLDGAVSARGLVSGDPVTISSGTVPSTDHAGLLRTPDGVLHVSFTRATSPGLVQAAHAAVTPAGRVTRRTDITGPWMFLSADTIVPAPGGRMRVILSGYDSLAGPYRYGGAYSATGDGTGPWGVPTERLNRYHGDSTDAVSLSDGAPVTAVLHSSGMFMHAGAFTEDNTHAPQHQQIGASGGYHVNLERVGDEVHAAWNALAPSGSPGTFVQRVHPTLGPVTPAPGSAGSADAVGSSNPSALAASTTGHLYSAYCAGATEHECKSIALWNVTTGRVVSVPRSAGARSITLSPAPDGRMWITWRSASAEVTGVRSNRTGTAFSSPTVRRMGDAFSFPHSAAESSLGFADVVLNASGKHVLVRLLPSLTVRATPRRWRAARSQPVRFVVRDAGDAVRGARVAVGGRSCRTDGSGRCTIRLTVNRPGRVSARIARRGYAPAVVSLRARR